ncbi:MAG: Flp family type IVb pilin [Syntrophomonadaceae bacterium]
MMKRIKEFLVEEKGQGMAEYGLILALIACVVMVALTPLGTSIKDKFNEVVTKLGGTAG